MTKPKFANNWVISPRTEELRREIQAIYNALTTAEGDIENIQWDDVGNKPTEFSPEDHTHVVSEVTDFDPSDYIELSDITVTSNSNGTSLRLPVGIQFCWISGDYNMDVDNGTATSPGEFTWDFPQSFNAAPIVVSGYGEAGGASAGGVVNQVVSSSSVSGEAVTWADATSYPSTLDISLLAVGTYT